MKKICCLLIFLLVLAGCGGGTSDSENQNTSGARELTADQTLTDTIDEEGEVDWYRFRAVEVNQTLAINCTGTYHNAPVDFMMTVYERGDDGDLVPLFGRSAPEDSTLPADLEIFVRIDSPKVLYIAVRDFLDDDASDQIPYRIEAHYVQEATDTSTFAQAEILEVDTTGPCHNDSISEVGEVNTYRFDIETEGVYSLNAQYDVTNPATVSVNLGIELYDDDGELLYQYKGVRPHDLSYMVIAHLSPGTYYVVIDDQGRNDTDAANYTVCVNSVTVEEMVANDTMATAATATEGAEGYDFDGTLEYFQDQDWYRLNVPASYGTATQNLIIQFARDMETLPEELSQLDDAGSYRITVQDSQGNLLHDYSHAVSLSSVYSVQIAAGSGTHYITVQPVINGQMVTALPYQLRVQVVEVNDATENGEAVTVLDPGGETVTGKISTLGDVDNYAITVDTTTAPKVVELYFDTTQASMVDFTLHVMWNGNHKILKDNNGSENGADEGDHFKSSFYLPQTEGAGTTVSLQVCDDQNNDGSDVLYTLRTNVLDIPTDISSTVPAVVTTTPVYHSEPDERGDANALDITVIEYDNYDQPVFKADTTLLRVDTLDLNNRWQSDWIAGFVDYDSDRDLFQLNFDAITEAVDAPEDWYFDIQVQFYADAGDVEYGWTLFRDGQPNGILLERTFWEETDGEVSEYNIDAEGVIACWADMETTAEIQSITVPRPDVTVNGEPESFWIGDGWGDSRFYLSIQDFNRAVESRVYNQSLERYDAIPNQVPDNDWGNTNSSSAVPPYYFRVTVTMHPGCSNPSACN